MHSKNYEKQKKIFKKESHVQTNNNGIVISTVFILLFQCILPKMVSFCFNISMNSPLMLMVHDIFRFFFNIEMQFRSNIRTKLVLTAIFT